MLRTLTSFVEVVGHVCRNIHRKPDRDYNRCLEQFIVKWTLEWELAMTMGSIVIPCRAMIPSVAKHIIAVSTRAVRC